MKCKNCKYWAKSTTSNTPSNFDHVCMHPSLHSDYNTISKEYFMDGANSYSTIATGPEFGCVHFRIR